MAVVPISVNVRELGVMRGAHPVPADDIRVNFIIAIDIRRMDPISGHSTPFSPFQLLSFRLSILQDQDRLRQVLDPKFAGVGIDTSSVAYNAMVQEIMERGLGAARRRVDVESRCRSVFLGCAIRAVLMGTDTDRDAPLTTALAESESEFERENYGMVAAREASIEKMLERVEVRAGDETCVPLQESETLGLDTGYQASLMAVAPISVLVHELGLMRETHSLPVDDIQVKLIIAIDLRRIDPITGHSIPSNTSPFSSFELVSFGLSILQNHDQLRQVLDPRTLGLRCWIEAVLTETDIDLDNSLTTALAESESEFERLNYGMVAASEASMGEMLERVEVGAEDETCIICLSHLEVGFESARKMPCSHDFHVDCIEKWLRQSHYCPICRFEMPNNQI
ncbi:hypothetical protein V6N12_017951 [Hibiscus sabdariffa]|uniref:RING-type E3 ubiquitin transferase n=1 Tax=Hibiscus sabdariffa TaxID=183260 RepID=A0ABR1ZLP9_9ROSI